MKKLVCFVNLYALLFGFSIQARKLQSIPIEVVSPGDTLKFKVDNVDAKNLKVHEQNRWRYLRSFKCKQDENHAQCSLTIQDEKHVPAVFSVFEAKNGNVEVKRYVSIKPED